MLLKIIRYIKGYIRIRVIGYSAERFLNACSHKGIFLWG
ncbi:sporulation protein YqfD, partial [Alistipes putredinis]|nr:sporulation protein YqfD [Alistipes putredinis]